MLVLQWACHSGAIILSDILTGLKICSGVGLGSYDGLVERVGSWCPFFFLLRQPVSGVESLKTKCYDTYQAFRITMFCVINES